MKQQINVLGIETSCDETAAAVIRLHPATPPRGEILSNVIADQLALHAPFGGVVPEIAARAHLRKLAPTIRRACTAANMPLSMLDAIAATAGPGLIGGLLIGLTSGKALAQASGRLFVPINHLEGHALAVRLAQPCAFPYLLLLASGGHCQLIEVTELGDYALYGTTLDDAAGEAFDKAAKLLGLGYPGGPAIEREAQGGDPQAFDLPRPMVARDAPLYDFSFSGLKTALRQKAEAAQPLSPQCVGDLAASFQAAILDCLADRSRNAMRRFAQKWGAGHSFVVAGGVAANQALRTRLDNLTQTEDFRLDIAPPALCTDNAAMIAWAAAERLAANAVPPDGLAQAARARWPLAEGA